MLPSQIGYRCLILTGGLNSDRTKTVIWSTDSGSRYLKIGWAWVKTALTQGWELFQTLFLNGKRDPEPALASRQQDERKKYRLEFTVRSFDYAC